jgi:hypothetical protein
MMELLDEELPSATILHVAHRPGLEQFHTREIAIVRRDPERPGSIVNRPFSITRGLRKLVRRDRTATPSARDPLPGRGDTP